MLRPWLCALSSCRQVIGFWTFSWALLAIVSVGAAQESQRRSYVSSVTEQQPENQVRPDQLNDPTTIERVLRPLDQLEFAIESSEPLTPQRARPDEAASGPLRDGSPVERSSDKWIAWEASGLVHNPLYFEDVALERYGLRTKRGLQSPISGLTFVGHTLLLPYRVLQEPPSRLNYTLGYRRPGDVVIPVREHPLARVRSPQTPAISSLRFSE